MKDIRFVVTLTVIMIANIVALYVLNFVSFDKKENHDSDKFLSKLEDIDNNFDDIEFVKKVKPAKVVVVEKEVIKEVKVSNINKQIAPAKEEIIQIAPVNTQKKVDVFSKYIKKFKKTNDFKLALKLSRLYYTSKDYKKSLKWAMIANELNDKDDRSWILFAKTKIKLGDKSIAKKALITYNKTYHSKKVKELLKRIAS
jgi:hypothetical protein